MIPTAGRIVEYTLTASDAEKVNLRRTHDAALGYVAPIGNRVTEGNTYPMLIVRAWGDTEQSGVNGQVFLDGNGTLWVTSVSQGDGPRHWRPFARVE